MLFCDSVLHSLIHLLHKILYGIDKVAQMFIDCSKVFSCILCDQW